MNKWVYTGKGEKDKLKGHLVSSAYDDIKFPIIVKDSKLRENKIFGILFICNCMVYVNI